MRRCTTLSSVLALVCLALAGCSSSNPSSSGSSTTTPRAASDPAINQWAITYTGGKAQKATGTPFKIGYVNQEPFFPEATIGVDAAVAYANAELNGADGHPIQIVTCQVRTPRPTAPSAARRWRTTRSINARAHRHAAQRQHRAVQRAERQEGGDHRQRRHAGRLHHAGG